MLSYRGKVKSGKSKLVVIGTQASGYRLGAQSGDKAVTAFGPVYKKQADAIAAGVSKFNKQASPVYPPKTGGDNPSKGTKTTASKPKAKTPKATKRSAA